MFNRKAIHFCNKLSIRLPIIQAPMAGGIVTPALISEVIKKGGLASLPLGYLSVEEARSAIRKTVALSTSKQFAVNIFLPSAKKDFSKQQMSKMLTYVNQQRLTLGLPSITEVIPLAEANIDELLEMIIHEGIAIVSFTFGILNNDHMQKLLKKNIFIMGTATTAQEGLALEQAGCHAVIAQGYEAGGHRGGGFLEGHCGGLVGTIALVPQMVDALKIPVIASGGIMDGRGIAAALILGASAVQMGTAFLMCEESAASSLHKQMILKNPAESTCVTTIFTGKPVRSFNNALVANTEKNFSEHEILPYPLQHQLTKELRSTANKLACTKYVGLWSGQGTQLSRSISVEQLMTMLEKETLLAFSR
ncbi:MAG: nitronate monooxygenase [Legionella sp.]|nr:nitronate monooxygenase [Legionella sp.]